MNRVRAALFGALLVACGRTAAAQAPFPDGWFEVPFPGQTAKFRARIFAPEGAGAPLPAVVLAHGSGGIDGRANPYIAALKAAGIAVMEIEMFRPGGRPERIGATIPHAIGALEYLSTNPAVDPARIGMMGFSWGGGLSLALAQERGYSGQGPHRYAAFVPIYPVCNYLAQNGIGAPSGAPLLILAGAKDDYDAPGDCPRLAAAFNDWTAGIASVHVYPDATHIWDSARGNTSFYDKYANRGSGGTVRVVADWPASRASIVAFASSILALKASRTARPSPVKLRTASLALASAWPEAATACPYSAWARSRRLSFK